MKREIAIFSGSDINFFGKTFNGAELAAVFGGIKCDLTNTVIENDCVIKAAAVFGGIDIIVPNNVNVIVKSASLFGGVSDKRENITVVENTITIYVNGLCMFGGVDIKRSAI